MDTRTSPTHPESGKLDAAQIDERIRHRAYELYEERGREDNRAMEDWLEAKAEVLNLARNHKAA